MAKLERFRGHFYNWYDTSDLRALEPKYVSSVDSGNLAGHLIVLGQACREIVAGPIGNPNWMAGLSDTIALLRDAARPQLAEHPAPGAARAGLNAAIDGFAASLLYTPSTPADVAKCLSDLTQKADAIAASAQAWSHERGGMAEADITVWAEALRASTHAHRQEIDVLMPWASLLPPARLAGGEATVLLATTPTLAALPAHCEAILRLLANSPQGVDLAPLMAALEQSADAARSLSHRLAAMEDLAKTMFDSMEFGFLFDAGRQLLSIGYRDSDGALDDNFYDLLASEARLASFTAIAKGDLPAKHWFRLGRTLTPIDGNSGLISWSGSMFEYLMPSLVMRAPAGSLLYETNRLSCGGRRNMATDWACPGACRNPNTTSATSSRPINIPVSVSPIWPISAASAKIPSSRLMPAAWRR